MSVSSGPLTDRETLPGRLRRAGRGGWAAEVDALLAALRQAHERERTLTDTLTEARPYVEWFTDPRNAEAHDRKVADDVLVLIRRALTVPSPAPTNEQDDT